MAKELKYLGQTEDGKYKYEKANGKTFVSIKKLHEDKVETTSIISMGEHENQDELDLDTLANSFGKDVKKGDQKPAGQSLKEVMKTAMLDVVDKTVTEEQVNDQTLKIIAKLEQAGLLFQVENNKGIQKKVLLNAEEKLMNEILVSKNKQDKRLQDATYNANEFAANIYGIDSGRPKWQIALARGGANVFFMIWFIISSITFTPIMFFLTMIGVQVKSSPLKWFFTILVYVGLIVIIWMIIASIAGYDNIPIWPNKPSVEQTI